MIEHSEIEREISKKHTIHCLYLSDVALNILEETKLYSNHLHPYDKNNYLNEKSRAEVTFDYSNNNGIYEIGLISNRFTIKVSSCGDNVLHLYKDPTGIKGVGLLNTDKIFKDIEMEDLKNVDMSSRVRKWDTKNIGVLLNDKNKYAILKLRSASRDKPCIATFEFRIL